MNPIDITFANLKRSKRKALIGYITAGFPTKKSFGPLVLRMQKAGTDILEIGIPFSDPVADGTTIQRSSQRALANGVTVDWILKTLRGLKGLRIPLIFMTYSNPILAMGMARFFSQAKAAGVSGVIIPDVIPEEGKPFERAAAQQGLALIYLAAPTTARDRLKRIARATRGFLYAVSLTGITGARASLPPQVSGFLSRLRRITRTPIALGFGISTPEHVRRLRNQVDGVIVGSALINHLETSLHSAETFIASLQKALNPNGKGA